MTFQNLFSYIKNYQKKKENKEKQNKLQFQQLCNKYYRTHCIKTVYL